ncbi:two-component response regulator [Calothrix sp. NIES-2100]|uniref:response regulator transcription factor n=1 Tax=Calothrix sp. NIES-2100 TaxID=1954172 RepID=UPI000B5FF4DF|nr:two-component response regulator [Calothrix sp. NIES-2100]
MNEDFPEKVSLQIVLVDSYDICLTGTVELLKNRYPDGKIISARTANEALHKISILLPDLIIMDILLPEKPGVVAQTHTGIQLLQQVMQKYPSLNILVHSAAINRLGQIKSLITAHKGGFTIADKSLDSQEMLSRVDGALKGFTHIKEITNIYAQFNNKPEVLKLLSLAFNEGLQDKAIAAHIRVSERMVRHYWDKLYAALDIDGEELKNQGKNIRIITKIRARAAGLID